MIVIKENMKKPFIILSCILVLIILYFVLGEIIHLGAAGLKIITFRQRSSDGQFIYVALVKNNSPFFRVLDIRGDIDTQPDLAIWETIDKSVITPPMGTAAFVCKVVEQEETMQLYLLGEEHYFLPILFNHNSIRIKSKGIEVKATDFPPVEQVIRQQEIIHRWYQTK